MASRIAASQDVQISQMHIITYQTELGGPLGQGWAGITFGTLGTGTGIAQPIPKVWEREWEWQIAFPTFGNGNGNKNCIPDIWEWEREWKLPSRLLGTGMRRWYSREWSGTGTGWLLKSNLNLNFVPKRRGAKFNPPFSSKWYILHCKYPKIML